MNKDQVAEFTRGMMDRVRELAGITEKLPEWVEGDREWTFEVNWGANARIKSHKLIHYGMKEVFIVYGRASQKPADHEVYLGVEESLDEAKAAGLKFIWNVYRR